MMVLNMNKNYQEYKNHLYVETLLSIVLIFGLMTIIYTIVTHIFS